MKWLLFILGLGIAFVAGYNLEPSMRLQLTGVPPKANDAPAQVADAGEPAPAAVPAPAVPGIDLASLTREQLPERVILKAEVEVSDASEDIKMKVPAGSRVALVRIENGNAVISPGGGPFEGIAPIAATDLLEQLAANPPGPATTVAQTDPEPAPEPEPVAQLEPEPEPAPPPAIAQNDVEMEQPAPTPEPAPAPAPAAPAAPADVVSIMQQSIRGGEIKEFTFDQVLGWKPEADETVDGETFQTGVAAYKADTIFGVKTIQAKALIKDGKVVRWIWPKSGMEIK